MKNIRKQFEKDFSKELAEKIVKAAISHGNGINNKEIGDEFKWALLMIIGYQCAEKKEYREYHGIDCDWEEVKKWIKKNAELKTYKGDYDYLSMMAGIYNEYI
jgi:hypothetical protein